MFSIWLDFCPIDTNHYFYYCVFFCVSKKMEKASIVQRKGFRIYFFLSTSLHPFFRSSNPMRVKAFLH